MHSTEMCCGRYVDLREGTQPEAEENHMSTSTIYTLHQILFG